MFRILCLSLLAIIVQSTHAQPGSVRGFVTEKDNGEPVMFTLVFLKDTKLSATTDEKGYFNISNVPPGDYEIMVDNIEFAKFTASISVKPTQVLTYPIKLAKGDKELIEVEVSGDRTAAKQEVRISVTPATRRDIQSVPVVGGTKDIINYLTAAVPGAITTGDQGGQLYIRGGSPIQNKVLLDGMVIYNPFHSIGFFSVFDTDIIRTADIHTGGYNAEFGGRISSIMDIRTRDGNRKKFSGKLDVNPFGSKLLLEGPLLNKSEEGGVVISYMLSAKTSYLEQSSKIFYPYINRDSVDSNNDGVKDKDTLLGLPFNFNDLYGKISINGNNGNKVNFFGFFFDDKVRYQAISDLNWKSYGMGANFVLLPSGANVLIEGEFSFSDYTIKLKEDALPERSSRINGFNGGFDFTSVIKNNQLKYGIDLHGFATSFSTFNSVGRRISQDENTTEAAAYIKYRIVTNRWVIEPSFRLHSYVSLSTTSPEPRIGIKYNVNEKIRIKAAAGMYSQNLISAVSDRDVVNLFYGFLSGPDNLQSELVREDGSTRPIRHALQKANHYIGGVEFDLSKHLTLNVEGYFKQFTQLTNLNRNKIFEESDISRPDVLRRDFIIETGNSYGGDVMLKYKTDNLYYWVTYSIAKVTRWDGVQAYNPVFDRRHNVNAVIAYLFGKDNCWEINGRWNFGSGFPFTQTAGFHQQTDFGGGLNTDYVSDNGSLGIIYGNLNTGRLPTYHRFDLTGTRNFIFYKPAIEGEKRKVSQKLQVLLGVTNLYNRANVFYVNRVTNDVVRQLPVMPSLGFNWEF